MIWPSNMITCKAEPAESGARGGYAQYEKVLWLLLIRRIDR